MEIVVSSLDSHQRLDVLEQKHTELSSEMESAVLEEVKEAYRLALENISLEISQTSSDPELQDAYAQYGRTALRGLEQLGPLEELLTEKQLTPLRERLSIRIEAANSFFEKYGAHTAEALEFVRLSGSEIAVASTVEVIPIDELEAEAVEHDESETIQEPKEIKIRISQNTIQLGRRGQFKKFDNRPSDKMTDYTEQRRRALIYLLAHQGEEVDVRTLWRAASNNEMPLDRNSMSHIRHWLTSVTYKRQPLILFNGKRGTASAYKVNPGFRVEIEFDNQIAAAVDEAELSPQAIELLEESRQPISVEKSDLYVTALCLAKFNDILVSYGIPSIDKQILEELRAYSPDWGHLKGNEVAIEAQRIAALERVKAILDDEDRLARFVDNIEADSAECRFTELIFDLDSEQRELIDKLFRAKVETEEIIVRGAVVGIKQKVFDEHGSPILPPEECQTNGDRPNYFIRINPEFVEATATQDGPELNLQDPTVRRTIERLVEEKRKEISSLPTPPKETAKKDRSKGEVKRTIEDSWKAVREITDELAAAFISDDKSIEHLYSVTQIRHYAPAGYKSDLTPTKIRNYEGGGRTGRNRAAGMKYDIKKILLIAISSNKKLQGMPKIPQKEIESFIDEKIQELKS